VTYSARKKNTFKRHSRNVLELHPLNYDESKGGGRGNERRGGEGKEETLTVLQTDRRRWNKINKIK